MKFCLFAALVGAAAAAQDKMEECVDCLEDVDEARDCLRICNAVPSPLRGTDDPPVSLLEECLDDDSDYADFNDIDGLVDCCEFDKGRESRDCRRDMENVQDCLGGCLDKCISEDAVDYVDCVRENTQHEDCSLETCLDGLLSEETGDSFTGGQSDIFDLETVSFSVGSFTNNDLENCGMLDDFVTGICDIGRTCCERCEPQMGELVSCLVNDIVIPFVALEKNMTIDTCPMDTDNCRRCGAGATINPAGNCNQGGRRGLREVDEEEAALFNKALSLPKSQRNKHVDAALSSPNRRRVAEMSTEEVVAECENKMRMEMVTGEVSEATNNYMECVTGAALASLSTNGSEESAAFGVSHVSGLVFALIAALLF